ncbi:hypothetical protein K7X08_001004 [Anisodus acutangulus]|uniref:Uncharacterized protein n=1 Tax=Anisodus acutangulus TaxID=402998 RepID=A0A9Q1RML3_9SOLA|nr:hypothetical protein K7X08_001004 [Anisodus acutangulus]
MCFGSRKDHTRAAAARPSGPVPGSGFSGSRAVGLLILSFWARKLCQKYSLIPEVSEVQFGPEFFQMYSLVPEVSRCTVWSLKFSESQNFDGQNRNAKHSIQPFILAELLLL